MDKANHDIRVGVFGTPDFIRRCSVAIFNWRRDCKVVVGSIGEALGKSLSDRPELCFFEIGPLHSASVQIVLRQTLEALRERFKDSGMRHILALTAPERMFFAGDLLFKADLVSPSGLVDNMIAEPPAYIPTALRLGEQLIDVVKRYSEIKVAGSFSPPPLSTPGWAPSLCDPKSRDLWMRWLPRYASYTNENPIIIGETGTGKTQLAFGIHLLSKRTGSFVSITPRDFSSSELVQAELFGAVSGAYTGAVDKWGLVKSAERGTLFFDELQSIDQDLQGKLITFIENKAYRRVGSTESINADVRFVFASNRSLRDMMAVGTLRDDFAYRLERVQLTLLPLRERRLDITAGLAHALAKVRRLRPVGAAVSGFSSGAYRLLFSYSWPGNLRQLENATARLAEMAEMDGQPIISERHVGEWLYNQMSRDVTGGPEVIIRACQTLEKRVALERTADLHAACEDLIECIRESALEASGGDLKRAASLVNDNLAMMELKATK
jgi:transcriptional regulator with AAA-type ATPase domain